MAVRLPLAVVAALVLTSPAAASTPPAPQSAPAPVQLPVTPQREPSPAEVAAAARIEAAGQALDGVMADLTPRAEAVRADATLSPADKETRIRAMMAEHQPAFDEFAAALGEVVRQRSLSDGKSAADADMAASMLPPMMLNAIANALITGEDQHDDADEHEDHEGH